MVQTRSNKFQFFSTSVQIYQISTYRTFTVHTCYRHTLICLLVSTRSLASFPGLLHVSFSLSDTVAALHFANVVKVSDKPKLFRKKSCLAPLFSFAALVADVSISVDALAMLFGCHIGRNVAVVYGCDNELMEAKVHKVG